VAHPRGKIRRPDLERAASTVRRAQRHTGGPAKRGPRRKPAPKRTRSGLLVALVLLAVVVVLWWVLFMA
jgi:hypothetical protein